MDTEYGTLTVFFEKPFWVGVFERVSNGKHYHKLAFSSAIESVVKKTADNPKRRQREARKQICASGIGTKSQQALQMQWEEIKSERKQISRQQREAEKQRQFDLKQQKRKEKHRGH
ncbi:MAG: YjdF family protein [Butyricicoccus sp.]